MCMRERVHNCFQLLTHNMLIVPGDRRRDPRVQISEKNVNLKSKYETPTPNIISVAYKFILPSNSLKWRNVTRHGMC